MWRASRAGRTRLRLASRNYAVAWWLPTGLLVVAGPSSPWRATPGQGGARRHGPVRALPVTKTSDLWSVGEYVLAVVLYCFGVRGEAVGEMERRAFDSLEVDPLELRDFAGLEKS